MRTPKANWAIRLLSWLASFYPKVFQWVCNIQSLPPFFWLFSEPISNRHSDGPGLQYLPVPEVLLTTQRHTSVPWATQTQAPRGGHICTTQPVAWLEVLRNYLLNEWVLYHQKGWPITDTLYWRLTKIVHGCLLDCQLTFNSNYQSKFLFMKWKENAVT